MEYKYRAQDFFLLLAFAIIALVSVKSISCILRLDVPSDNRILLVTESLDEDYSSLLKTGEAVYDNATKSVIGYIESIDRDIASDGKIKLKIILCCGKCPGKYGVRTPDIFFVIDEYSVL